MSKCRDVRVFADGGFVCQLPPNHKGPHAEGDRRWATGEPEAAAGGPPRKPIHAWEKRPTGSLECKKCGLIASDIAEVLRTSSRWDGMEVQVEPWIYEFWANPDAFLLPPDPPPGKP